MRTCLTLLASNVARNRRAIRLALTALLLVAAAIGLSAPFGSSDS